MAGRRGSNPEPHSVGFFVRHPSRPLVQEQAAYAGLPLLAPVIERDKREKYDGVNFGWNN